MSPLGRPRGQFDPRLLLALAALAGCPSVPGQGDPRAAVAVSVADDASGERLLVLTRDEVASMLARARLELDRDAPELTPAAKRALLEQLVEDRLLVRAARASGVEVSPQAVGAELRAIDRELGGSATVTLSGIYRTRADLARAVEARLLIQAFLAEVTRTATPTESEVRAAFSALDPDARRRPERVHASQIVVETEREARRVKKRLATGEDFAALAREVSIAPEAPSGGDLGWFERGSMPPVFETACFALAPGEVSPVIASTYGYHVFLVHDRMPAEVLGLEGLRDDIRARLTSERVARRERAFRAGLKDGLTITLHAEVLDGLGVGPAPSRGTPP